MGQRTPDRVIFLLGFLILIAVGAGHPRASRAATLRPKSTSDKVICPTNGPIKCPLSSQPSPDEIRAAMQSLYFYAYKLGAKVPPGYQPMPLDRVVCTLMRDRSPRFEERRRLAIMKLVGSLRVVRDGQPVAGPSEACAALIGLSAPLQQILNQVELSSVACAARDVSAEQKRLQVEQQTQGVLEEVSGPVNNRCAVIESCNEPQDLPAQTNGIAFTINVHRTFSQVESVMDPQTWDECNSDYFPKVYIAAQDKDGSPVIDDTTGDAQEASSAPAPGSDYGNPKPLPLFQHFAFNPCGTSSSCSNNEVSFKNILNITAADGTASSGSSQHQIDYKFSQCIQSDVLGSLKKHTGIDVDDGFVRAIDDGTNGTDLAGRKILRFSTGTNNAGLNTWAQALLPLICDEVAGKAGGGVCCNLGP